MPPVTVRREPNGRPAIGFQLEAPGQGGGEIELSGGAVVRCRELRDGRVIGELEASVFAAALIIDRDGVLSKAACDAIEREVALPAGAAAVHVALPGASGFRASAVRRAPPLPYVHAFAIAAGDVAAGGAVLVMLRTAGPEWLAGEYVLRSLRVLTRHGRIATSAEADDVPMLPLIAPRDRD